MKNTHIIAVLNQKGGVGKTTTTVNTASYLAKMGKKVLLVDLDPQGNATSGLGIDKNSLQATVFDALFNHSLAPSVVLQTKIEGLDILPANQNLAGAEIELVKIERRELQLALLLYQLPDYDVILIDCPPSLGLLTVNALCAAHSVLIPVQTEYYALEGLGQLLSVIQRVSSSVNQRLQIIGVLLTMYDSRTTLSDQVMNEVRKHFGQKLFKTIIPRNIRLAEAPSYGKTIQEHDKWSKGARAYKQLSKELMTRIEKGI
jgi:chromosome partitioning protein